LVTGLDDLTPIDDKLLAGVIFSEEKMIAGIVDTGKDPKIFNISLKLEKIQNNGENP
jgi:hypothetical protein